MAMITDCSPEEALWVYHNEALDVVEQTLQAQMSALAPQLAAVDAAVAEITATLEATFGPDDPGACSMPSAPTKADIEAMVSTPTLSMVSGRIVLPGTLSLVALRRLYGIFGSLSQVGRYIPEFSIPAIDPAFGNVGVQPRLLVIELRLDVQETAENPCAPDVLTVTEREVLVSVNSRVSEADTDRILVCVWIGTPTLTDGIRQYMVELGLTDDEIIAATLSQSSPGFEVYAIPEPNRLWVYAQSFISGGETGNGTDNLGTLLSRPIDAVNDAATATDIGLALRNAMSTPTVTGCGFPVALGLLSTLDVNSLGPLTDPECDMNPNIYGPVNEVFGAMGSIQRTINRVMLSYQTTLGKSMAGLVNMVTNIERKYLGRGLVSAKVTGPAGSFGATATYMGSFGSASTVAQKNVPKPLVFNDNPPVPNNGIPTAPKKIPAEEFNPDVLVDRVQYIINQLDGYMQLFTDSVNAVTQVVVGMSLLMCSQSWVGNTLNRFQPRFAGTDQLFKFARPPCADATLNANIDLSSINFDLCNVAISMLRDLIHRLLFLLNSLIRAQNSSNALMQLNCSVTETTQLAADIGRRLAAHNWGRF